MRRQDCRKLVLAAAGVVAFTGFAACSGPPEQIEFVTVRSAAEEIERDPGKPDLVMIYSSQCPNSRRAWPLFVALADHYGDAGVSVHAYSADQEPGDLIRFLGNDKLPFRRQALVPWEAGELTRSMGTAGIQVPARFTLPLIAVRNADGELVGQGSGPLALLQAEGWLREAAGS